MLLNITQSSGTSTFHLKHLSEKTQQLRAQQMTFWDSGFESLTSYCSYWGVWCQSHLLQQQITIHEKIPRATTMTKDAMITYSTLHSASKTPEINTFWHLTELTVHIFGDCSWERKGKAWPFGELEAGIPHWQQHQILLGSSRSSVGLTGQFSPCVGL